MQILLDYMEKGIQTFKIKCQAKLVWVSSWNIRSTNFHAYHQTNVICKVQIAYEPPTNGHKGVMIKMGFLHDAFDGDVEQYKWWGYPSWTPIVVQRSDLIG